MELADSTPHVHTTTVGSDHVLFVVDRSLLHSQAKVNILSGACFAIGLKYAGTANKQAQHVLVSKCIQHTLGSVVVCPTSVHSNHT